MTKLTKSLLLSLAMSLSSSQVFGAKLIYENGFERGWGKVDLAGFCSKRGAKSKVLFLSKGKKVPSGHKQFQLSSAASCKGKFSARVILDTQYACDTGSRTAIRSEIVAGGKSLKLKPETEYWLAHSIFLPKSTSLGNPPYTIMGQTRENGSNNLRNHGGNWQYVYRNSRKTKKKVNLGPIQLGKCTRFVFRLKRSHNNKGIVQIWVNGVRKYSALNTTFITSDNPNSAGPRVKRGVYYGKYGVNGPSKNLPFIAYIDSIKIAEGRNGYSLVAP